MSTTKRKYLLVITYCIALVCILAGLFFPLGGFNFAKENLLFMMLPSALGSVLGTFGVNVSWDVGESFTRYFNFNLYTETNLMAWAVVFLAIIAVVGILMLIPIFISKAKSKVAAGCAYTVEVLAFLALAFYTLMNVYCYTYDECGMDWSLVGIAMGGTALMLVVQSIIANGTSGVMKLVMAILGAAGVFVLMGLPILIGIPGTAEIGDGVAVSFAGGYSGLDVITLFFAGICTDVLSYDFYIVEMLQETTALASATAIVLAVTALVVVINFAIDAVNVATKTSRGSTIFDIIRYAAEAVLAAVSVLLIFLLKNEGFEPGILLYTVIAIAIVQLVLSIIRCVLYKESYADEFSYGSLYGQTFYDDTAPAVPVHQPAYSTAPAPYAVCPYAAPAPVCATGAAEDSGRPPMIYLGPTDAFISRLATPEKIEFAKLFIEKINGPYANIPDYVVGGDNREFFKSLFIYLGRFRPLFSDELMKKIYEELNLLS